MMVYELYHGFPPFFSKDKKQQIENCISKEIVINSKISPDAQDFIRKLLQPDVILKKKNRIIVWEKMHILSMFSQIKELERQDLMNSKIILSSRKLIGAKLSEGNLNHPNQSARRQSRRKWIIWTKSHILIQILI